METRSRKRRLIIVDYRLPLKIKEVQKGLGLDGSKWLIERDGIRSPISNYHLLDDERLEVLYIGSPSVKIEREDEDDFEVLLSNFNCVPVYLDPNLHHRFYQGCCRSVLWKLFHYNMETSCEFAKDWDSRWQAYTTVNMIVCRTRWKSLTVISYLEILVFETHQYCY